LLFSVVPDLTPQDVKEYLKMTALHEDGPDSGPGPRYGEGIIDVFTAVTAVADDNVVSGTVTDSDGDPVAGVTVESGYGTTVPTNEDGEFELYVGDGSWDITVDAFGYATATETVSVSGGESVTQDLTLDPEVGAALDGGQPDVAGLGESFDIVVRAANLEALTVDVTEGSDLAAEDLTVSVAGTELTPGEQFSLPEPITGQAALTVTVGSDAPTGTLALTHEFSGAGATTTVETGPTDVMEDPEPATFEIVDWAQTQELDVPGVLVESCTVENTGDKTGTQAATWWLGDPSGANVFPNPATLAKGEQTTIEFLIRIPASFAGVENYPHGWFTQDDEVQTTVTFFGPDFEIANVDAPSQIDRGETLEVTVEVENVGNAAGGGSLTYLFDGVAIGTSAVSADTDSTASATVEFDTNRVVPGRYTHTVQIGDAIQTVPIRVGDIPTPPAINGTVPTDPDDDGLFEDFDGDGEVTMNDVRVFGLNYNTDPIQENPQFFDFDGDGDVTVSDVRTLFSEARQ
jgi:hypothetical protein